MTLEKRCLLSRNCDIGRTVLKKKKKRAGYLAFLAFKQKIHEMRKILSYSIWSHLPLIYVMNKRREGNIIKKIMKYIANQTVPARSRWLRVTTREPERKGK